MKQHPVLKSTLTVVKNIVKASLIIEAINAGFLFFHAFRARKHAREGLYYEWKYGDIFYSIKGSGSPVILLHGYKPSDSGNDMNELEKKLSREHTVYTIDLLGFGFSSKPWITYTNFLYVSMIKDFINEIIHEKADVYAVEGSCLFVLQANKLYPDLFGDVNVIDPCRKERVTFPKKIALRIKALVDLPVYGTFLYNIYSLAGGVPVDPAGRHVFVSRLTGHLSTDITDKESLITDNVNLIENDKPRQIADDLYVN